MKPRLWIASELFFPEETSTGYFITRIAEGLTNSFDVHVICTRAGYSARGIRVARREVRNGATIHRLPATSFDKDRLGPRLLNVVTFSLAALIFAIARLRRGDIVLAVTNPPSLPFVIAAGAMFHRARRILLVHDVYPEVLAATRMIDRNGHIFRLLTGVTRWLYRRYDRVIVLGRDMAEVVGAKLGDRADRLRTITNWGTIDTIGPQARDNNGLRRELGLEGKFIVQFSGNIGRTHDLTSVLAAAAALRSRTDVHFLLVGYGKQLGFVRDEVERRNLSNVTLLPRQPSDRLATMLACSDLTVIAFVADMYGVSVPSRMYNVMAAGVAIAAMADPRSELALVVAEESSGWVLDDGDADALTLLISDLADDTARTETRCRGANGRRAVVARFSRSEVLRRFADEVRALAPIPG